MLGVLFCTVRYKTETDYFLLLLNSYQFLIRDVVYQHAPSYLLSSLDAVYHGALRFITVNI